MQGSALLCVCTGVLPTAALSVERIPTYTVAELNESIGKLLERGFAPRFLLEATVIRPQLKKGHLWLSLTDGSASIQGVVWSSRLSQLTYQPLDGDGVTVVGKLNFWASRASLTVQALDIRPSLSTVLLKFEQVRRLLEDQGVINSSRQRALPEYPRTVAVLTSAPSSALADMLRTARERWPMTTLLVVPIPVQGAVADRIAAVIRHLGAVHTDLRLDALVLARGGGSREDLSVFDDEDLCRAVAMSPVPVVTGLGHEDDLTVADLVADHRAATPTAAMVALLPERSSALRTVIDQRSRLREIVRWRVGRERQRLQERRRLLTLNDPKIRLKRLRGDLDQRRQLLLALSPSRWLKRGLALVENASGSIVSNVDGISPGDSITIQFNNGKVDATVDAIHPCTEPNRSCPQGKQQSHQRNQP